MADEFDWEWQGLMQNVELSRWCNFPKAFSGEDSVRRIVLSYANIK